MALFYLVLLDIQIASRYVHVVEEDDMEAVRKAAAKINFPLNRHELFNRVSSLPEPKAKMKKALKERLQFLALAYISLATFIDDEDVEFSFRNKKSKKTKALFFKVIADMEKAKREMRRFKLVANDPKSLPKL